ncbi:MAG: peptidoglycan DD-metalloendopeptidase family protein [Deltaproteobacteria bacterium]|nr:peptidoglycan DD-metalloendopeptidase family protein [Deltaproteobacteria bacterium]
MNKGRRFSGIALLLAAWIAILPSGTPASDSAGKLREEKARLMEMKRKAEKTAAELADTLKREKTSLRRVGELQARLAKQRRLIERIDRRLLALEGQLDRTEEEVRALGEEQGRAERGLRGAAAQVFAGERERMRAPGSETRTERLRYFARWVLAAELARYGRLTADKEEKERTLSGIEQRIEVSERRMAEQKKVGEKLLSQREAERRRLSEIEQRKKAKEGELRALRARIARMEALVSRIERKMRERERQAKEPRKIGPKQFSGVSGGLVPPLAGKVVGRFGRQRDPVFDVTVENRGVEIEASPGAAVHAIGKGEVVFAGSVSGFGKVLILQHGSGLFSVYGKADSFSASLGQKVGAGEEVGRMPASPDGKSVLYLELRAAGTAIDPVPVIPLTR